MIDSINADSKDSISGIPQGKTIILVGYSDSKDENIFFDIDMERSETVRRMWPFFRDRRIDSFADLTKRWREE